MFRLVIEPSSGAAEL